MIPMEWLTPRERAVYERRAAGATNADIAAELQITPTNVATAYIAACRRIENGGPRAGCRRSLREQREALRRFDEAAAAEPRCGRCGLRGHAPGDPERCLSIYAVAVSQPASRDLRRLGVRGDPSVG